MQRICFPCIYHTYEDSLQVHFPDFPEIMVKVNRPACARRADTVLAAAHDYLATHIYNLAADKRPLPSPTPFSSVPVPIRGKKTLLRLYLPDQPSAFLTVNKWLAAERISWREAICIFSRGAEHTWEAIWLPDGRWYGWIDDPVTGDIYPSFRAAVKDIIVLYAQEYGWPLALAEPGEIVFHDGGCPRCGAAELLSADDDGWERMRLECVFDQCRHRRLIVWTRRREPPARNRAERMYDLWRGGVLPYPKRYVHYYNEAMLQALET